MLVLISTVLASVLMFVPMAQATGGKNNRGDVWTKNVGQPSGPGHQQDPHLDCADINLWGDGMADASGSYTIDSWQPSGQQEQAYSSTWHYNKSQGGPQVIDVIDVETLLANARANGDAPVNKQGYHFKLQLSQEPQKHKTFWVNCPAPTPPPSCGETHTCPPPPSDCNKNHTCPPPSSCGPGESGTPPHCTSTPPECPSGTTPTMENDQWVCVKVVVTPGPTQVITTPCPCDCPKGGKKHKHHPKPKCPKVKKSKIKVSFTPKNLKHGNVHLNIKVPAKWHVKKVALAICTPKSGLGHAKSCKKSAKTFVKKFVIKLNKHGKGHLVLPLWRTDIWGHWLYGNHRMELKFHLDCGLDVEVLKSYFNLDPQPGVVPPMLR